MNIYHHPRRRNQPESWTLVMVSSPETREIARKLPWRWHHVVNFFGPEVMLTTTYKDLATGFALGHGLQIEEGTEE